MTSPNVLLIHSDQHRYDCVGAHGLRGGMSTPHLDELTRAGTSFSRAYSTSPICTPARASLLTGAWPTTHGCLGIPTSELDRPARPNLPLLTRLLADAGYQVAWTGKFHRELEQAPGAWCGVEDFVPATDYAQWRQEQGIPPTTRANGWFGEVDAECPSEASSLAWQADQVIRQIEERRDGPFFVRWDPPEPHLPCAPTQEFFEPFADAMLAPWQSFPDSLEGKPVALRRQARIWGVEGWTWEDWLPVVRRYHAIVAELDYHVGRVLSKLNALGLAENTLVLYSTDHGDFCGGHGLIDKHFNMYEDVVRVPLISRWPGVVPAGRTAEAFVSSSVDLARTILSAARIDPPASFIGEDLVSLAQEPERGPRKYGFSQYFGTESGLYSCRMIRDQRYKFVYHPVGDRHEFYDLEADPGELRNRIDDAGLSPEIDRLKVALWETMHGLDDPLANLWTAVELKNAPPMSRRGGGET